MTASDKLKDTLNLPKTSFPMRANAVEREPARMSHWEKSELYQKMQEKNKGKESFVLHDGPPFTNGDVHVGTALNKILKDSILRYKNARGFRTPYLPGWDCHGLPIEHKVTKKLRNQKKDFDSVELRQHCEDFSKSYIETQRAQFKRLGVLADWENEYRTMTPAYEGEILRTFADFVEQGLVYRSKKPVYWSIPCQTALAEAEIEYKDHVSPSIFVRFQLQDDESQSYLVIWTTTPGHCQPTLRLQCTPANRTRRCKSREEVLDCEPAGEEFAKECGFEDYTLGSICTGADLAGKVARHPFIDRESKVVPQSMSPWIRDWLRPYCPRAWSGRLSDRMEHGLEIYCPLNDGENTWMTVRFPSRW